MNNFSDRHRGFAFTYMATLLLGLSGPLAKAIPLDSSTLSQVRGWFGFIVILLFVSFSRNKFKFNSRREILITYLLGLFLAIHWLTFFIAVKTSTIAIGVIGLFTFPVLTALIEPLYLRKRPVAKDVLLALLALAGLCIAMIGSQAFSSKASILLGGLWGLVSALFLSLRSVVQKYHCKGVPSQYLILHQLACVALIFLPFANFSAVPALSLIEAIQLFLLVVFCSAVAQHCFSQGLKLLSAKTVALISYGQPVIGIFIGWLLFAEAINVTVFLGVLIVIGVSIYEVAFNKAPPA